MAIYPYKCLECGRQEEVVQSISSYSVSPNRPSCCSGEMQRVMVAPMLMAVNEIPAFKSMIDGEVITSRTQRSEHMQRHGVVLYDDIAGEIEQKARERNANMFKDLKQDLVDSMHKVEAGHKPVIIPEAEFIPTANA